MVAPTAQRSARPSTSSHRPRACSGGMNPGVPIVDIVVCEGACVVGARKSPVTIGKLEAFVVDHVRRNYGYPRRERAPRGHDGSRHDPSLGRALVLPTLAEAALVAPT